MNRMKIVSNKAKILADITTKIGKIANERGRQNDLEDDVKTMLEKIEEDLNDINSMSQEEFDHLIKIVNAAIKFMEILVKYMENDSDEPGNEDTSTIPAEAADDYVPDKELCRNAQCLETQHVSESIDPVTVHDAMESLRDEMAGIYSHYSRMDGNIVTINKEIEDRLEEINHGIQFSVEWLRMQDDAAILKISSDIKEYRNFLRDVSHEVTKQRYIIQKAKFYLEDHQDI